MILYFENSKGNRRVISNPFTIEDMWTDIHAFANEHSYTIPYTRINFGEDELVIDVGSHTEFFVVKRFAEEDKKKLLKEDKDDFVSR